MIFFNENVSLRKSYKKQGRGLTRILLRQKTAAVIIMGHFLSIVEDSSRETEINEEKLKYFTSQIKIWDYYGIPQQKFLSLPTEEKSTMLKKYYNELDGRQSSGKIFKFLLFSAFLLIFVDFRLFSIVWEVSVW